jgi:hypothetical protein
LRIRAFGYVDYQATVRVSEERTTRISVVLREAPFTFSRLKSTRPRFNPGNPGPLGTTVITFSVSGPGTGVARIIDQGGQEVLSLELALFTDWEQELVWDGSGTGGKLLSDGLYEIRLEGASVDGSSRDSTGAQVAVDSSLVIAYRSLWSGLSGLLYVSTPDVLPASSFQLSTLLMAHASDGEYRAPVVLAGRLGLGRRAEIDAAASIFLESVERLPAGASVGAKLRLIESDSRLLSFSTAATARAGYLYGSATDTLTNPSGLTVGLSSGVGLGPLFLVLAPELVASPRRPNYDTYNGEWDPGSWAYGRAGFGLDLGSLVTGISASVRTVPFGASGFVDLPFQAAWEAHWLIPRTQLLLTVGVAGEFESRQDYYLMSGAGLSLLE